MNFIVCCGNIKHVGLLVSQQCWQSVSEDHRIVLYQNSDPMCRCTGKAAVGFYVMQVIAWCVYSYSAPFSQPAPIRSLLFPSRLSSCWLVTRPTNTEPLTQAQGDPCHQRRWQNKKIASVSTQLSPQPHASSSFCVHSVFVARVKRPHSVSGFPHTLPLSTFHPLKVYLRLRFSDNEGLKVHIHSSSSPSTPIQRAKESQVEAEQCRTNSTI